MNKRIPNNSKTAIKVDYAIMMTSAKAALTGKEIPPKQLEVFKVFNNSSSNLGKKVANELSQDKLLWTTGRVVPTRNAFHTAEGVTDDEGVLDELFAEEVKAIQ